MSAETKRQSRRPKSGKGAVPKPAPSQPRPFDSATFLAKVGEGRTLVDYPKDTIVFAQGDPADAVFFLRKGKVKLTVMSSRGKEAVVALLDPDTFFGEGCLIAQCGWRPPPRSRRVPSCAWTRRAWCACSMPSPPSPCGSSPTC